jgi:hypothetical protein
MSDTLRRQCASDAGTKLRLPLIIYCITTLLQALSIRVLADTLVSANTADPVYNHIQSKIVNTQIAGGESADEDEFPYMVMIYRSGIIRCGGAILSSQWVLTAARCLVNPKGAHTSTTFELHVPKSEIKVGYGSIKETALNWATTGDVWIHPQYSTSVDLYNLALIKLTKPLSLSGKWSPVRITPEIASSGDELITLGWGEKEDGSWSDILQKIRLTVGSDSDCQSNYPGWDGHDGKLVCTASGRERGICEGDPGGPLVLPTSPNRKAKFSGYLVGITTFRIDVGDPTYTKCGNSDLVLNYFTRTAEHVDWIANVMGVDSSELLATPGTESDDDRFSSEPDDDDEPSGGKFRFPNSAVSLPMKSFDNTLRLMALYSLVLAIIAFNN